jgi:hypothetical protein
MGTNLHVDVGPIIICDPKGKTICKDVPDRIYDIWDESGSSCYKEKHVFAPNREGYTIAMEGSPGKYIETLPNMLEFIDDYSDEIEILRRYYGDDNVKVRFSIYSYWM